MAQSKLYYTTPERLESLPVTNGNIIFVPDGNMVCLDFKDTRFTYQTIKVFATEEERRNTPFLNDGFYFVAETNVVWRWTGDSWKKVTPSNLQPTFYGETKDLFPEEGNTDSLYFTDDGIYNWKAQFNEYNLIANANTWESI